MRAFLFVLAAASVLLSDRPVWAGGRCELETLVGYQVMFSKVITAYVEAGKRKQGYQGCQTDRVLVFGDNSGLRCKTLALQKTGELPVGFLFANNAGDLKLCVDGELMDVTTTN